MPSSISASSTTTSISFSVTLTGAFTISNYMEVGVTDKAFTNDSYSLAANSIKRCVVADPNSEIQTTSVGFTITTWGDPSASILPGHTYTFYGYARAANGKYYQIPAGGGALTVTTQSYTPSATAPYDLICTKRKQASDLSFDFNITVPQGTEELIVEMSLSNAVKADGSFVTASHSFRKTLAELTHVGGNTYAFSFGSLVELTTYYIHAYVVQRVGTSLVASDWCATGAVSTPLRRQWISDLTIGFGTNSDTYYTCYLRCDQWNDGDNADYFSYITFELFCNGSPAAITHKRLGSSFTELSAPLYMASFTATETDSLLNQNNGFAALLPSVSAVLTAHVRIYSYINGVYLQPVDADGNEYEAVFTLNYDVGGAIDKYVWRAATEAALEEGGYVSVFTYGEWNDIMDKIKEVLDELGYSWDSTYASFANTKMSAQDKYLTAARFNSARYNIGIHYATGISQKARGDAVYGSDLLTLVAKLNEWIDAL